MIFKVGDWVRRKPLYQNAMFWADPDMQKFKKDSPLQVVKLLESNYFRLESPHFGGLINKENRFQTAYFEPASSPQVKLEDYL